MNAKSIIGYSDEISVTPGQTVSFMVSCEAGVSRYQADIVRVRCGDAGPGGPGLKEQPVPDGDCGIHNGRRQALYPGAHIVIPDSSSLASLGSFTLQAMVQSTRLVEPAVLMSRLCAQTGGFQWLLDPQRGVGLRLGAGAKSQSAYIGQTLLPHQWYFLAVSYDGADGSVVFYQELLANHPLRDRVEQHHGVLPTGLVNSHDAVLSLAAEVGRDVSGRWMSCKHFNGRMERPGIIGKVLSRADMEILRYGDIGDGCKVDLCALWDFSLAMSTDTAVDISGNELHGELVNLPIRAVQSTLWDGSVHNWQHQPAQYGAIHFVEDSLYDAGWAVDFQFTVPEDLASGCYAARLSSVHGSDRIPFFVRPKPGTTTSKLAFLVPTASYMAYANGREWEWQTGQLNSNATPVLGPEDLYLLTHPELGLSTYDKYMDGTGVCYSSRLRPVLSMRGEHRNRWQYSADLHLVDWLDEHDYSYDVITDEDLHRQGVDLMRQYTCVLTGTHPEYYSTPMWDGWVAYLNGGGRLMYMGGNGFYWRIAYRDDKPGVMEMRRAEGGSRSWRSLPGEYYMGFTGEYGGLWWRAGRTPQSLTGVGFTAQGFDLCSYYRRNPDSFNQRAGFIFEGIDDDELIGDFGIIGGGAAGLELDRYDLALGTPPHALNLASSEGHTDTYLHVTEDLGHMHPAVGGLDDPDVRADMVFFETKKGGGVWSTGSIAWCASLHHQHYDNNVSRITRNVLDRFLDSRELAPVSILEVPTRKDGVDYPPT